MTIGPLKAFVSSRVCLSCDGCCRFKEPGTIWRPKLTDEETRQLQTSPLAELIFQTDARDANQFIRTKPGCGEHLCQFFNTDNHHCAIYNARPFECELYPFVMSRNAHGTALYVHLNCPFVQDQLGQDTIKTYEQYLYEFFRREDVRAFLLRNRAYLNDYSEYNDELLKVFDLEGI